MSEYLRYEAHLDSFSGPLDLLLHLIKESKLDIHEIKISEITEQYFKYIKAMENMHLEIASEYLVMAANLMYIKSKKLLPRSDVEIEEEYEEDPEAELMRRLLEYQIYKESLDGFRKLEEERGQFYTKPAIDFSEYIDDKIELEMTYDATELILAFEKLLRRQKLEAPIATTIVAEKITVEDRVRAINEILLFKKSVEFHELFERYDKEYVVVTFLALLEMAKSGEIELVQVHGGKELEIVKKGWVI